MSLQVRQMVTRLVHIQNAVAANDLLNPAKTQSDLIALLQRAVYPLNQGGLNYDLILTAINSDHHDDSALGLHGHTHGYSVDCWPESEGQLKEFLQDMATHNHWVTKIGLGGSAQQFMSQVDWGGTIVFYDNASDHIHLQSQ